MAMAPATEHAVLEGVVSQELAKTIRRSIYEALHRKLDAHVGKAILLELLKEVALASWSRGHIMQLLCMDCGCRPLWSDLACAVASQHPQLCTSSRSEDRCRSILKPVR